MMLAQYWCRCDCVMLVWFLDSTVLPHVECHDCGERAPVTFVYGKES